MIKGGGRGGHGGSRRHQDIGEVQIKNEKRKTGRAGEIEERSKERVIEVDRTRDAALVNFHLRLGRVHHSWLNDTKLLAAAVV